MYELLLTLGFGLGLCLVAGLLPMKLVRLQFGALLAADTSTLAPATANTVNLIVAPFNLTEDLDITTLVFGTTNGLVPIACQAGAQEVGIDPVSQQQIITIIPGATSGFRWLTSGTFTAPITVFGYALVDHTGAVLLGAALLPTPIAFTQAGQQLDLDPLQISIVLQPAS